METLLWSNTNLQVYRTHARRSSAINRAYAVNNWPRYRHGLRTTLVLLLQTLSVFDFDTRVHAVSHIILGRCTFGFVAMMGVLILA